MPNQPSRLRRAQAALLVVDLQEKLVPAMFESERLIQNSLRLVQGAAALGLPLLATEQYPKGLGPTVPVISSALTGARALKFEKVAFSACRATGLLDALASRRFSQIVLCGIEAHVCVSQTCLDLLENGFQVFLAVDAVSSRTPENMRLGLDRMRQAGIITVSVEMALFELIERAGTDEFKRILTLIK